MSFNLDEFIKQQKLLILEEKVRLEQKHLVRKLLFKYFI